MIQCEISKFVLEWKKNLIICGIFLCKLQRFIEDVLISKHKQVSNIKTQKYQNYTWHSAVQSTIQEVHKCQRTENSGLTQKK